MAAPVISNIYGQTANAQNYISWSAAAGATSYTVQRSTDGINFSTQATVPASLSPGYVDSGVVAGFPLTPGTQYWYQVTANGSPSTYTAPVSVVPTTPGEVSLGQIRLLAQQRADRVNSNFVTLPEWNEYIRLACYELYDILITVYDDLYIATPAQFITNASLQLYPLPDGLTTFTNGLNPNATFVPPRLYKLRGVDLGLNPGTTGTNNNGWVSIHKFMFAERNKYFYPNTHSTIYGVFNMCYRMLGNNIEFIPTPSSNQPVRLWFIPCLTELLQDTDMTSYSISGWIYYVIMRAAKYALDKEESDTTGLGQEILFLKTRIEAASQNRDAAEPDRISDTRNRFGGGGWSYGSEGFGGAQ